MCWAFFFAFNNCSELGSSLYRLGWVKPIDLRWMRVGLEWSSSNASYMIDFKPVGYGLGFIEIPNRPDRFLPKPLPFATLLRKVKSWTHMFGNSLWNCQSPWKVAQSEACSIKHHPLSSSCSSENNKKKKTPSSKFGQSKETKTMAINYLQEKGISIIGMKSQLISILSIRIDIAIASYIF